MTKQKEIEEMAQFICRRSTDDICIIDRTSCDCNCAWARTAEAIYNAGYRKVLLDTENGYAVDVVQYAPWQLIKGHTEREVERTRKETAKDFAEKLKIECDKVVGYSYSYRNIQGVINELLEEYDK